MDDDPNDRAWADYTTAFREIVPKLVASGAMVMIGESPPEQITPHFIRSATELGVMLLLGKPMVLVVAPGEQIPDGLLRAAAAVIPEADLRDPATQDRIAQAIRQVSKE